MVTRAGPLPRKSISRTSNRRAHGGKKQQRGERLILGGSCNFSVIGEMVQESGDLAPTHLLGVSHAMEANVALDLVDVGLLGLQAVAA